MGYDLIILRSDWLFTDPDPVKYETLTYLINKAYSKPMAKYGIIRSNRIKSPKSFLQCLGLSPEKEPVIVLLLGSSDGFEKLEREHGFDRKFKSDVWPLSQCNDSDLPPHLVDEFGPLVPEFVRVHNLEPHEALDSTIINRCLATLGFKRVHAPESPQNIVKSQERLRSFGEYDERPKLAMKKNLELELTAYTSFMPRGGAILLEYIISEWLANGRNDWFTEHDVSSYTILASVIKEHDLVSYYTKKCGFVAHGQPDCVVKASNTDSPLEPGVIAASDFTVSFLKREVNVSKL